MANFKELPESAAGLVSNNRTSDSHWGKPEVIAALLRIGATWAERDTLPNPPISIGHISRKNGEVFPPHKTHRTGDDIDIRPMRTDGKNAQVRWQDAHYSRALTRDAIKVIRANMPITSILFNDPVLIREGLCQYYSMHHDHLHVNVGAFLVRRTLKRGDKGDDVKELQRMLGIEIDGHFGPDVEHAIREFQAAHNLKVDGRVGPATWRELEKS